MLFIVPEMYVDARKGRSIRVTNEPAPDHVSSSWSTAARDATRILAEFRSGCPNDGKLQLLSFSVKKSRSSNDPISRQANDRPVVNFTFAITRRLEHGCRPDNTNFTSFDLYFISVSVSCFHFHGAFELLTANLPISRSIFKEENENTGKRYVQCTDSKFYSTFFTYFRAWNSRLLIVYSY